MLHRRNNVDDHSLQAALTFVRSCGDLKTAYSYIDTIEYAHKALQEPRRRRPTPKTAAMQSEIKKSPPKKKAAPRKKAKPKASS